MNFKLIGRMILNREISDDQFEKDLKGFIKEANDSILIKGAPSGKGAVVTDWKLKDNSIHLTITSGQYVRPHEAILRLKKNFGDKFGKKYKLGVRTVSADNYLIDFPITQKPTQEFSLPFVKEIKLDSENLECHLAFEGLDEEFLRQNYIDRIIRLVNKKIADQYYAGKGDKWELLWKSEQREHGWSSDPTEEMIKLGWLKQGPTKGKWFYHPQLTVILRAMEKIAMEEILEPLDFSEIMQSHLVPFDVWLRTGHLEGNPNEFYYVSEPRTRDVEAWENFSDYISITHQVPDEELQKLITTPRAGICYAQCPGIYWAFQGKVLADESLPILIYDRTANSNRYESGGRHGIERVDEFHRLEPVYIGTPEQLKELREKFIERYKHVFNDILELEWRMAWVTPWYMEQSGQISDTEEDDKIKGTIDFEAYLPYRGTREESEWLEYQNLSIIGDKFINAFNIKSQHGELWSGCSGIGLERWSAVFLAQKGLDPVGWPAKFNEIIGELPKGYKTL
jgi:seryl-tRNA synthetase